LSRNTGSLDRIIGPKLITAAGEDAIEIVLRPPDLGVEPGELPDAIDLLVPVRVGGVGVALDGDLGARGVGVALVGDAQLVHAYDLVVGHLLPLGAADKVLRHEKGVAEHGRVGDHADEFIGRHRFPELVQEGAVVDLCGLGFLSVLLGARARFRGCLVWLPYAQSRGNASSQPLPIFGVVAIGPLDETGRQTQVVLKCDAVINP
jgi:hypothetical protein